MEGAVSLHGDIHEAAPSELWEKASFAPTNEPSLAYLEFLWNQCALSDFWLLHVQQRFCRAWGMKGFFFKRQTEIARKHSSSWEKIEKNKEIITCPMYEPFTRTKTAVCARHGEVESNQLIPCEDSCWCMWSMLYWQGCHLEAFSVTSSSCPKSQGPRVGHKCWWTACNPVDVRCHSTRYCPALMFPVFKM